MPRVTVNEQNDHNNGRKQRFLDDDINIEKGYFFFNRYGICMFRNAKC